MVFLACETSSKIFKLFMPTVAEIHYILNRQSLSLITSFVKNKAPNFVFLLIDYLLSLYVVSFRKIGSPIIYRW